MKRQPVFQPSSEGRDRNDTERPSFRGHEGASLDQKANVQLAGGEVEQVEVEVLVPVQVQEGEQEEEERVVAVKVQDEEVAVAVKVQDEEEGKVAQLVVEASA